MYNTELYHYGVGHLDGGHSGRYPWGSGKHIYQRTSKERYTNSKKETDSKHRVRDIAEIIFMDEDTRVKYHKDIDNGKPATEAALKAIGSDLIKSAISSAAINIGVNVTTSVINRYTDKKGYHIDPEAVKRVVYGAGYVIKLKKFLKNRKKKLTDEV